MTDKEFRKMKRSQLLELMSYMRQEIDALRKENKKLNDRMDLLIANGTAMPAMASATQMAANEIAANLETEGVEPVVAEQVITEPVVAEKEPVIAEPIVAEKEAEKEPVISEPVVVEKEAEKELLEEPVASEMADTEKIVPFTKVYAEKKSDTWRKSYTEKDIASQLEEIRQKMMKLEYELEPEADLKIIMESTPNKRTG